MFSVSTNRTGLRIKGPALYKKGDTQGTAEKFCLSCLVRSVREHCPCNMALDSWQVNGYVVNLFWSFGPHSRPAETPRLRPVCVVTTHLLVSPVFEKV